MINFSVRVCDKRILITIYYISSEKYSLLKEREVIDLEKLDPQISLTDLVHKKASSPPGVIKQLPLFTGKGLISREPDPITFNGLPKLADIGRSAARNRLPEVSYIATPIIYELSCEPLSTTLLFIAIINTYVEEILGGYSPCKSVDEILDGKKVLDEMYPDRTFMHPQTSVKNFNYECSEEERRSLLFRTQNRFIENLLTLTSLVPQYSQLNSALDSFYQYAHSYMVNTGMPRTFAMCVTDMPLCNLVLRFGQVSFLHDPSIDEEQKNKYFRDMATAYLEADRISYLEVFLRQDNNNAKIKLIESCYGRKSKDGSLFKKDDNTECKFLMESEFDLDLDLHTIHITNHNTNEGYTPYREGTDLYSEFEPEIRFLCDLLNLPLEKSGDFHKKITFSPEASKRLITLGLHYNVSYLKSLIIEPCKVQQKPVSESLKKIGLYKLPPPVEQMAAKSEQNNMNYPPVI